MITLDEIKSEIDRTFKIANNQMATKSEIKKCRDRLPFLRMVRNYMESVPTESIKPQLTEVNKKIALHNDRIASATANMNPAAAKHWAANYSKSVGLGRLNEYRKTLEFICDESVLNHK